MFCKNKSLLDCLINVLPTKNSGPNKGHFFEVYDNEIINCQSGIFFNILFWRLLSKTKGKATLLFFLKSAFSIFLGHQYLIRCFYGTSLG